MNLIRKYKISKILHQPLTGIEGEIIELNHSWLNDLIPFKMFEYTDSIYYMNSKGEYVLEQDNKYDRLWVRYKDFWSVLESKYLMKYKDIQILLKFMVEEAFKQKVATPTKEFASQFLEVEEAFKQKVATPINYISKTPDQVEEAFKQKVSTPYLSNFTLQSKIEEAFKEKN